jgi:hypothetical protein
MNKRCVASGVSGVFKNWLTSVLRLRVMRESCPSRASAASKLACDAMNQADNGLHIMLRDKPSEAGRGDEAHWSAWGQGHACPWEAVVWQWIEAGGYRERSGSAGRVLEWVKSLVSRTALFRFKASCLAIETCANPARADFAKSENDLQRQHDRKYKNVHDLK